MSPEAAEGSYLDMWVDGDLSYRFKPSRAVKKARQRQLEGGVYSGSDAEPLYGDTYLPRKFKVAVTVPGDNSVDLLTQDIGLVAFTDPSGDLRGCNVYVGGGMGRTHNKEETFARTADPLGYVAAADVLDVVQAILALQRDHGDREVRKHARMKYLLHDKGIQWFRDTLCRDYFTGELKGLRNEPKAKLLDYLGWHRQKAGLWFVGLPLLCGRLEGEVKQDCANWWRLTSWRFGSQPTRTYCFATSAQRSVERSVRHCQPWASMSRKRLHLWPATPLPARRSPPAGWRSRNLNGSFRPSSIAWMPSCVDWRLKSLCWFG